MAAEPRRYGHIAGKLKTTSLFRRGLSLHAFSDGICDDWQLLFMMPQERLDQVQLLTVMTQLNDVRD